ncbi:MAG: hypothetical protein SF002_13715 [Alphaproteobacteria bacterium]|nr:hypothetical protein [Alphaproteobacteria bacterium]
MGFLDEQMKRLKALFGDDPVPGISAPPGRGTGILRAEVMAERSAVRQRRVNELRERLAAMNGPGTMSEGIARYISLKPIRDVIGERWPDVWPKIELMAESVVRRESNGNDISVAHGEHGIIVLFTQPGLSVETVDLMCAAVFEDIRRFLLGDTETDIPTFDLDPAALLAVLNGAEAPPIRLAPKETVRWWRHRLAAGLAGADPAANRPEPPEPRLIVNTEAVGTEPEPSPTDWGRSDTRSLPIGDFGTTSDQPQNEVSFNPTQTREELLARYSAMGRKATEFDDVEVRLRRWWQAGRDVVSTHAFVPTRQRGEHRWDWPALLAHADRLNAQAALDINVMMQGCFSLMPRFAVGARCFFLLPVAYPTLLRRADREAYFDLWALVPEPMRRLGRFWAHQPISEIGDTALTEVAAMLKRAGLQPVFTADLSLTSIKRAMDLKLGALLVQAASLEPRKLLEGLAEARQRRLIIYVGGVTDPDLRRQAVRAGAQFLSLGITTADTLPDRPQAMDVEEAAGI